MTKSFHAEIRLGGGQYVNMNPGGTVEVVAAPPPPDYTYKLIASHPETITPVTVQAETYDSLVAFFKQLENLGYVLNNMERVSNPNIMEIPNV